MCGPTFAPSPLPRSPRPWLAAPTTCGHAGVSLWLAAGVPTPRVAERARHSVKLLLRLSAKCLGDDETIANTRIDAALRATPDASRSESPELRNQSPTKPDTAQTVRHPTHIPRRAAHRRSQ